MNDSAYNPPWPEPDAVVTSEAPHRRSVHPFPQPSVPPYPMPPLVEPELKAKLLSDWQLVKGARFNAAARLEKRHWLSLVTLATVALYGGLVAVFVLIFRDSFGSHARGIFDWVAAVASWLTLTFSLTEQIKNHSGKARELHDCARQINDLRKHLQASVITAPGQLRPFIAAYDRVIAACGTNHEEIDYRIARLQADKAKAQSQNNETARTSYSREIRAATMWSSVRTYAPYVIMSLAPALAGLMAWTLVPPPQ